MFLTVLFLFLKEVLTIMLILSVFVFVFVFVCFLGLHPQHMEVPRLWGGIGATAVGLHHSHSNAGSEPFL